MYGNNLVILETVVTIKFQDDGTLLYGKYFRGFPILRRSSAESHRDVAKAYVSQHSGRGILLGQHFQAGMPLCHLDWSLCMRSAMRSL